MNETDRLNLKRMINQSEWDDNTDVIRNLKHSNLIRKDLALFNELKRARRLEECQSKCSFLYNNYADIFNRLVKNELDLSIFDSLLNALKQIEDGMVDQHEGSVVVGTILKKLYIDSALKHADNLSEGDTPAASYVESKKISWTQYKALHG